MVSIAFYPLRTSVDHVHLIDSDADILAWKRQFANFDLRNASALSNSAEDLTQLDDQYPYQPTQFSLNYHDMDEGKIRSYLICSFLPSSLNSKQTTLPSFLSEDFHFEDPVAYDYQSVIQDRLKRANQELEHDETPSELKHHQRVSFDAVVRAVDIEHDSQEHETVDTPSRPTVPVVAEEPTSDASDSKQEPHPHQYTVPLNDTQAREGPTLLETLRARQFHGITPTGEPWSIPRAHVIHAPDQDKSMSSYLTDFALRRTTKTLHDRFYQRSQSRTNNDTGQQKKNANTILI